MPAAAFQQSQQQLLPGPECHDEVQFRNLIAQDSVKQDAKYALIYVLHFTYEDSLFLWTILDMDSCLTL